MRGWEGGTSEPSLLSAARASKKCTHDICDNDPLTATESNKRTVQEKRTLLVYNQTHLASSRACTSSGIGIESSAQISSASWLGEG